MPMFQTVAELAEEIADLCGVYGPCCDSERECGSDLRRMCRSCFTSKMGQKINSAVATDRMLERAAKDQR